MQNYLEFIGNELKALTSIPSPSGYTKDVAAYLMKTLSDMGYEPQLSNKGNVFVTIGGEGNPLVLAAHVDTLGAMVRSVKANGRLRPTTLGGHQWSTADGENCTIHTRDGRVYTGVVLNTEPSVHVADSAVETKEENMEILLDENVDTKEGTLSLGVQPGDIIAMDPRTQITPSGYIKSRFLDDKLSASILLGLAKCVKDESIALSRKVSLLFTVYEEVGHGGSFVAEDTTEMMLRALVVSNLITIHMKTGIGRLSAYCGAISAGCGAGAGICYLYGGRAYEISHVIVNAVAINSGVVCDQI